jgi:hypothetical protein
LISHSLFIQSFMFILQLLQLSFYDVLKFIQSKRPTVCVTGGWGAGRENA